MITSLDLCPDIESSYLFITIGGSVKKLSYQKYRMRSLGFSVGWTIDTLESDS